MRYQLSTSLAAAQRRSPPRPYIDVLAPADRGLNAPTESFAITIASATNIDVATIVAKATFPVIGTQTIYTSSAFVAPYDHGSSALTGAGGAYTLTVFRTGDWPETSMRIDISASDTDGVSGGLAPTFAVNFDLTGPVFAITSPADLELATAATPIVMSITDATGVDGTTLEIVADHPVLGAETVYTAGAFVAPYLTSTLTGPSTALVAAIARTGGWPEADVNIAAEADDVWGASTADDFDFTVLP